jgi:predicted metal-binding membrane protein
MSASAEPLALGRARLGLAAALVAAAVGGWWWTIGHTEGMDGGPWTALGAFGWFVGVWLVMMAAMMLPSVAPTVLLYGRMQGERSLACTWAFVGGYLVMWVAVGVSAYGASRTAGDALAWNRAGRWIAGAVLVAAALYELTPLKDVCLGRCRSPLGFLLGAWRDGPAGALRMGVEHGAWCVGCCWALMASLFALGVMSVPWMALVAGLIAFEKLLPYRRAATWGTALVLFVLGALMLAHPDGIPGLAVPLSSM